MTDQTDKPSIRELQELVECVAEGCWTDARERLDAAIPLLLEIAAAVLAVEESRARHKALCERWVEKGGDYGPVETALTRFEASVKAHRAALDKVRP